MADYTLLLWIALPLLGAIVVSFIPKSKVRQIKNVSLVIGFIPLLLTAYTIGAFAIDERYHELSISKEWIAFYVSEQIPEHFYAIAFELGVNGFSFILLVLTTILGFLSIVAATKIKEKTKGFYQLLFILQFGMLGVFAAQNVFLFFLFFEITLLPMFFLILRWGYFESEKAAYSYLVYNGIGSLLLLVAFIIMFARTGTANYDALAQLLASTNDMAETMIFTGKESMGILLLLLVGFGIKLPIVPLHTWMVRVHNEAPIPVVMLHAGVLLKIGAYGIITFAMNLFPAQFEKVAPMLLILGLVNLVYGAWIALSEKEIKKIMAYSSISHMGIVLLGLASLQIEGVQGAIFQVVSHGFIAALLFYLIGLLEERYVVTRIDLLSGMAKSLPLLAGFFLFGGMASLGLPGLSGFVSELQVFIGVFKTSIVIAVIGAFGLVLTAAYILRAILQMTFGKEHREPKVKTDIVGLEWFPVAVLSISIFVIGVFPAILSKPLHDTVVWIIAGFGG